MLNGYEELENFHDLDETELDYLGITEPAQRAKILTAVELMQDNSTTCKIRYHPRFFDQIGHQSMYTFMGNKHFFTKQCHCQTYQNYEQSRQQLGTFLVNKVL